MQRHRSDYPFRRLAVLGADRRRGQELRSPSVHRQERRQEDGRLHPVRHRRLSVRDGRCQLVGDGGYGDPRRRVHRLGDWRVRHDRTGASGIPSGWATPDFALFHSRRHHQSRRRPGLDPLWGQGAELGDLHGLFGVGTRHRGRVRDHQARRGRRDDRRRIRGRDHADGCRRLCGDARAVDAQR